MHRRLRLSLVLVLLPTLCLAQFAVIDTAQLASMAQQFQQQINMYREMIEQSKRQVEQIHNQMRQIQHAATTVQHGAQNLLTLDVNSLAALLTLSQQLDAKLQYVEYVGFESQRVWGQAQQVYPQIQGAIDGKRQRDLQRQWAKTERATARAALETQAIVESQRQYSQEWQHALQAAVQAKGALQVEQAQAQMLGIQGSQLQQIQQHLGDDGA